MSEAQRPIEALHAWFQDQHHEVQAGVAERLAFLAPDVLTPPIDRKRTGADTTDVWIAQIAGALKTGVGTMTPIAFVLFMRSMVSFSFVRAIPDAERERQFLQIAQEMNAEMAAASAARRLEAFPFREKLWSRALTTWEELCRGVLSDESIYQWLMTGPAKW